MSLIRWLLVSALALSPSARAGLRAAPAQPPVAPSSPVPEAEVEDADPFGFSRYRERRPEPMGSQTILNGARMDIASLLVEDPPRAVMAYYLKTLSEAGVHNILQGQVERAPGVTYLSFRPPGSKNLKTLTLVPHGRGCIILASVGNPEQLLEEQAAVPDDLPLPPDSERAVAIQQLEPGMASRNTVFRVHGSTVRKVRDFYREELGRHGYSPVALRDGLPGMDSYQKGASLISISARPHADASDVAVSIVWMEP